MANESGEILVSSRRFGAATVALISEGTFPWHLEWQVPKAVWREAIPEADASGAVLLGINVACIRHGNAAILVDPGFDDASAQSPSHFPGLVRSAGLIAGLSAIGLTPEQITHDDHVTGVTKERHGGRIARFPNARHFVGRRDWEGNPDRERAGAAVALHLGTLERLGLLTLVDDAYVIVPGVTMLAAPGESPGHTIVEVAGGGTPCFIVGDLFHHACEVAHPDWISPGRDLEAMRRSRERLMAGAAAQGATVVFTHAPFPGWGRIVAEGAGYRWEPG